MIFGGNNGTSRSNLKNSLIMSRHKFDENNYETSRHQKRIIDARRSMTHSQDLNMIRSVVSNKD